MQPECSKVLFSLCCWAVFLPCIASQCVSMRELNWSMPESSSLKCGHVCPREHGWKTVPVLWAPLTVQINCSSSSYTVVTGHTGAELVSANASTVHWCGWHHILKDPRICSFSLSPLQDQYLAVEPAKKNGLFPGGSPFTCDVVSTRELSVVSMCCTIVGVLLFLNANRLTMNEYFRLTSGSLMFMSGAVLVLVFILMRSVPYKRSLAAAFTISGTSLLALVRWLYGTWLPDAHTLVFSRPFAIYMGITAVVGWGVTYWLDDTNNVKLNNTIRVMLQMLGLSLVYSGISDERVAVAAVILLVFGKVLWTVGRRLFMALWWLVETAGTVVQFSVSTVWRLIRTVFTSAWQLVRSMLPSKSVPPRPGTAGSAAHRLVHRKAAGAGRAADLSDGEDQLLLSDEEAELARRKQRIKATKRPKAPPAKHQLARAEQLLSSDEETEAKGGSPLHFRTPPPVSAFVLGRSRLPQEFKGLPQRAGNWFKEAAGAAAAAVAAPAEHAAGYKFPSSTPPPAAAQPAAAKSPWSSEKKVFDLDRRNELGSPTGTAAAPAKSPWSTQKVAYDVDNRPQASPAPQQQQRPDSTGPVSPLVKSGRIMNPETGRAIWMYKEKYNQLLALGYTPDLQNGVLVAPDDSDDGAAAVGSMARQRRSGAVNPQQQNL